LGIERPNKNLSFQEARIPSFSAVSFLRDGLITCEKNPVAMPISRFWDFMASYLSWLVLITPGMVYVFPYYGKKVDVRTVFAN